MTLTQMINMIIHPTQKPVAVLKQLIEIFTDPGDVVIDPVAGSGTTLRGCMELGRSCYGIDTGVHIAIPAGNVGMLKSKSGLNVKHNITSEGVIDAGYTGSIVVKLYNHGKETYAVRKGDKISQLVILPIITPELELVSGLEESERGEKGFGSSGR